MNAKAAAILRDPHPCGHIVYPYTDEELVAQAVSVFASSGLRNGEGVILIMTASHSESITSHLAAEGFDVEALQKKGLLVRVLAEELLSQVLVDGKPNKKLFQAAVGGMIRQSRASTGKGAAGQVRAFGEMVSLLWDSDLGATISLEDLWNEIIEDHHVSLMCTYALNGRDDVPDAIHHQHTHSVSEAGFACWKAPSNRSAGAAGKH